MAHSPLHAGALCATPSVHLKTRRPFVMPAAFETFREFRSDALAFHALISAAASMSVAAGRPSRGCSSSSQGRSACEGHDVSGATSHW